MPVWNSLDFVC